MFNSYNDISFKFKALVDKEECKFLSITQCSTASIASIVERYHARSQSTLEPFAPVQSECQEYEEVLVYPGNVSKLTEINVEIVQESRILEKGEQLSDIADEDLFDRRFSAHSAS